MGCAHLFSAFCFCFSASVRRGGFFLPFCENKFPSGKYVLYICGNKSKKDMHELHCWKHLLKIKSMGLPVVVKNSPRSRSVYLIVGEGHKIRYSDHGIGIMDNSNAVGCNSKSGYYANINDVLPGRQIVKSVSRR